MPDVRNRQLAEVTRADDFIVSDSLVSLLLSQIAENRDLNAVFGDLFVVHCQDDRRVDPVPFLHFASSRSTARRRFMILCAAFICASNAGLCGVMR